MTREAGEVEVGGHGAAAGLRPWPWHCWRVVVDEDDGFGLVCILEGIMGREAPKLRIKLRSGAS